MRLTTNGLQKVVFQKNDVMIFLSGKPLSGALNDCPGGKEKRMNFYRGNCAGAIPFQFKSMELALDAIRKISGEYKDIKVFSGNLWIGNIVKEEFQPLAKPVMQLL